jgi:hypothetical protein
MHFETLQVVLFIHYVHLDVGSIPVVSTTSTSVSEHPNSFQHLNNSTQRNISRQYSNSQDGSQSTHFDTRKLASASLHRSSIPALFPKHSMFSLSSSELPQPQPQMSSPRQIFIFNVNRSCTPLHVMRSRKSNPPVGSPLSRGVACVLCMQSFPMASC